MRLADGVTIPYLMCCAGVESASRIVSWFLGSVMPAEVSGSYYSKRVACVLRSLRVRPGGVVLDTHEQPAYAKNK